MYVVDTDVLIDVQRGYQPALDWFSSLAEQPAVPGFVIMELVQDAQNKHEVQEALKLVEPLPVVWPNETDCRLALENFQIYHLSHNLGLLDALIAACATNLGASLCTFNLKHYRAIPDLLVTAPYEKSEIKT